MLTIAETTNDELDNRGVSVTQDRCTGMPTVPSDVQWEHFCSLRLVDFIRCIYSVNWARFFRRRSTFGLAQVKLLNVKEFCSSSHGSLT